MEKNLGFILMGCLVVVLGIYNLKGNISTIHWYNRHRVSAEDVPKYGKCMGIASIIIGGSFILTAILEMILHTEAVEIISFAGCIIGVIMMLYGQFRYNKGIF